MSQCVDNKPGNDLNGIRGSNHGYFGSLAPPITESFARLITPGGQIHLGKTPRNSGNGVWIITRLFSEL